MNIRQFEYKMIDYNFAILTDDLILFKLKSNKWELYNAETEQSKYYEDLDHEDLIELIEPLNDIEFKFEGGRGASGGDGVHKWGGGPNGKDDTRGDLPSRMNNKIKVKTDKEAINKFREKHGKSKTEHLITVDKNGFVSTYNHGGRSSVGLGNKYVKGDLVIHNHPSGSTFSTADMYSMAGTKVRGVVATHPKGYRIVTKGTHFDAQGFVKAVQKAEKGGLKGKNINDAVDKFLKRNQKKYGYTFNNVLD